MKLFNLFNKTEKETEIVRTAPDVQPESAAKPYVKTYKEAMNQWEHDRHTSNMTQWGCPKVSRHEHIAFSIMRGRSYKQVENKTHQNNKANINRIEMNIQKYFPDVEVKWNDDKTEIILVGAER